MKFFNSPFNTNVCGKTSFPAGSTGKIKLLLVDKNGNYCHTNFLHNQNLLLDNGAEFITATSVIDCDIVPEYFIIYLEENNTYSWVLENSISVNIYDLTTKSLLATKIFGKLDDLILLEPSRFIDKPSMVLHRCGYESQVNLNKSFIKIEFKSLCDNSSLDPCCDQLPESVGISGYDILCIPLRDNYEVPDFTTTTTTLSPAEDEIKILQHPYIVQSKDVEKYYLYAFIDTKYGSDFSYWWERSEDNVNWTRITELTHSRAFSKISLSQVKERDYFYRLYINSPSVKITNPLFYDYIDYATITTTTTTTTTLPPLPLSPPSIPLNFEVSGGGFRQTFLTWNEPIYDGRSDRIKYGLEITLNEQSTIVYDVDIPPSSTSLYQDIDSEYDGILLDYSLRAHNFFGYSPAATVTGIQTLLLAPPTVSNLSVSALQAPYRMELDWDTTGVNENYPLLGHTVKYRPSGSSSAYTANSYDGTDSQLTILDSNTFDNCETYEFVVTASNSIGESSPASGYATMAFLPSAPVNLNVESSGVGGGNVDLNINFDPPIDSGRCEILNYVYQYKLATDEEWGLNILLNANETNPKTESIPSGNYIVRVAAINIAGTGNYAVYGDWVQVGETIIINDWFEITDFSRSISNDGTRLSFYSPIRNPPASRGYVYDFNGCSWSEKLNVQLSTTVFLGTSKLFNNNNSVAFFTEQNYVPIYTYNNNSWSLSNSLTGSEGQLPYNYSSYYNYSYNISGSISHFSNSERLYYLDENSSSFSSTYLIELLPVSQPNESYTMRETSISQDGSTLCIIYVKDNWNGYYSAFAKFYSIDGLSLTQVGDAVELGSEYLYEGLYTFSFVRLSEFGDELLIIPETFDDNTVTIYRLSYSSQENSWNQTTHQIILPALEPNIKHVAISSDLNSICFVLFSYEAETYLQAYKFDSGSWSTKGNLIKTAASSIDSIANSDQGDVIVLGSRIDEAIDVVALEIRVYRYAASEIDFPICIPTTTTTSTTTSTTTPTPTTTTTAAPTTTTAAPGGDPGYIVSGAGSPVNDTYCLFDTYNGQPRYKAGIQYFGFDLFIQWSMMYPDFWIIGNDDIELALYINISPTLTTTGWEIGEGDPVPPTLSATTCGATAYLVSGAGEIGVNGTYCYGGEFEGKPYYQYNSPELGVLYMFFDPDWEIWTIWNILETNAFDSYYNNEPTFSTAPDAAEWYGEGDMLGWEIGANPAPTVTQTTC